MKTAVPAVIVSTLIAAAVAHAGAPGTLSTDYAVNDDLQKVTVGIDGERVGRTVSPDGGADVSLDVVVIKAFAAYDVLPHLTVFATAGGSDDRAAVDGDGGIDSPFAWSVGANINVLNHAIRYAGLLAGDRVTVRLLGELSGARADTAKWVDFTVMLPIAYEIAEGDRFNENKPEDSMVLALYAGPMVSVVDGEFSDAAGGADFDAAQEFGVIGGVDLHLSGHASVGGFVKYFDQDDDVITAGGSLRFHF